MRFLFVVSLLLMSQTVVSSDFVTTWKTDNYGPSNDTTIQFSVLSGPYDVDWNNDGVFDEFGLTGKAFHDYGTPGIYTVRIRGPISSIWFDWYTDYQGILRYEDDVSKIISLDQWGTIQWDYLWGAFERATNLQVPATDRPDLSKVSDLSYMFRYARMANPDVSDWDVSGVESTYRMFEDAKSFDQDLGSWDVGALEYAEHMFHGVTLSSKNYEKLLIGWSEQALKNNVKFGGGNSTYCSDDAIKAKEKIIDLYSWEISDGGFACPPQGRPTGVIASDGEYIKRVKITFDPVESATLYRIFRCPNNDYNCGPPVGYVDAPVFFDQKGSSPQVYYYRVKACVANACGKFSDADSGFAAFRPWSPVNVRATRGTYPDKVQITWDAAEGATVYRVFHCPNSFHGQCGAPIGFIKGTSFEDKKVDPGVMYYYRVKACNSQYCSEYSALRAGYLRDEPALQKDASKAFISPDPNVSIPVLSTWGRWLLVLMTMGFGVVAIRRHCQ